MTGELAQLVSLASFGNAYLKSGALPDNYYPQNPAFGGIHAVTFVQQPKVTAAQAADEAFVFPDATTLAADPLAWFQYLKQGDCLHLRLLFQAGPDNPEAPEHQLAGFVGGGSRWFLEAQYADGTDTWIGVWDYPEPSTNPDKPWAVVYDLLTERHEALAQLDELEPLKARFLELLEYLRDFADDHGLANWARIFVRAHLLATGKLHVDNSFSLEHVIRAQFSPLALQLLMGASAAWVFGGMGSWNDLSFDNERSYRAYDELSAELYTVVQTAVAAAVNSTTA